MLCFIHVVLGPQVEPFLLAPQGANLRERDRRKELMRQRFAHLKLGVLEDNLPQELQLSYIKCGLVCLYTSA